MTHWPEWSLNFTFNVVWANQHGDGTKILQPESFRFSEEQLTQSGAMLLPACQLKGCIGWASPLVYVALLLRLSASLVGPKTNRSCRPPNSTPWFTNWMLHYTFTTSNNLFPDKNMWVILLSPFSPASGPHLKLMTQRGNGETTWRWQRHARSPANSLFGRKREPSKMQRKREEYCALPFFLDQRLSE